MHFSHFPNPVATLNTFTIIMLTVLLKCKEYSSF